MRPTFHLVPAAVWASLDPSVPYAHPSLATEGFIHCTDGADNLRRTADRHYRGDPRPFVVLVIDLDAAGSPWRIDEPGSPYPHVYGPIERQAILRVSPLGRRPDGSFEAPED